MTNDTDAILDDLLCKWAQWVRPITTSTGHQHHAAGCGAYRTSRQYDDTNGALDDDLDHMICKAVDGHVGAMPNEPEPYRLAIHAEARRLVVGVDVFRSARLPTGEARRALIVTARGMLVRRLTGAGVM